MCKSGDKQSPIEISPARPFIFYDFNVSANYDPTCNPYLNTTENWIMLFFRSKGFIANDGDLEWIRGNFAARYCATGDIRFHTPSEHTFNNTHRDVEMQIFHEGRNGRKAIASIFFDRATGGDQRNEFIAGLSIGDICNTSCPINL